MNQYLISAVLPADFATQCLTLFFATLLHEEVALVAASYLLVEQGVPAVPVAIVACVGIIAGDWLIYLLGVAARHLPLVKRWMGMERAVRSRLWLQEHLTTAVVVARLFPGPGVLFPAFFAMGSLGIPFTRFAATTAAVAAVYTPLALLLLSAFGAVVVTRLGQWAWLPFAVLPLLPFAGTWRRRFARWKWALLDRISLDVSSAPWLFQITHRGLPRLGDLRAHASIAEHIPPTLFYVPLGLYWAYLGMRYRCLTLPTIANPRIEGGGLFGESKISYLDQVQGKERRWLAPYASVVRSDDKDAAQDVAAALTQMRGAGLDFPVVAKPDIGWRGYGVRLLREANSLSRYISAFPAGERIILQKNIDYDGEAGVFYIRRPGQPAGFIPSLTLRYFPYVVGDGAHSIRDLIDRQPRAHWKASLHLSSSSAHRGLLPKQLERIPALGEVVRLAFIGSNRVGGLYRDGRAYITSKLERRFDAISQSMPDFYFGRYDIRFASIERLQQGEDFSIIEINGAGAEAIHVWDPNTRLIDVYKTLFSYQAKLFETGDENRRRGFQPAPLSELIRLARKQRALIPRYPPSG